jgi:hypothetical protein
MIPIIEWMPENPIPKEIHPVQCGSIRYYEGKRDGFDEGSALTAKKILTHLREWQGHPMDLKDKITQMLIQLEGK